MKLLFDSILHAVVGTVILAVVAVNNAVTVVGAAAAVATTTTAELVDITTSNPVIVDLSQDFERSNSYNDSPGMDMVNALATAESNTQIVTVIQHGKIVGEYHRDDANVTPNQLHPTYSVTKAVSGMLFGILVDQYDTSINTTLGEFFPNETDWNLVDEANVDYMKSLSAYEILTMTTGLGVDPCWVDASCPGAWGGADLQSALAWPLKTGERGVFEYTSMWEIVSYIIKEVTDLSPRELLATEILPFLGINDSDIDWPLSNPPARLQGETFASEPTAWGLELTTTQMAKIGQLFLQKGLAAPEGEGGTQVLPSEWIETSLTPKIPIPAGQVMNRELPGYTYGYQQWMVGDKEETESDKFGISYISEGRGGQQIVVHPQSGIVLAVQSNDPFDPTWVPSSNLLWFIPLLNEGPDFFVSTTTTADSSSTTASNDSSSLRPPSEEDSEEDNNEGEPEEDATSTSDSDEEEGLEGEEDGVNNEGEPEGDATSSDSEEEEEVENSSSTTASYDFSSLRPPSEEESEEDNNEVEPEEDVTSTSDIDEDEEEGLEGEEGGVNNEGETEGDATSSDSEEEEVELEGVEDVISNEGEGDSTSSDFDDEEEIEVEEEDEGTGSSSDSEEEEGLDGEEVGEEEGDVNEEEEELDEDESDDEDEDEGGDVNEDEEKAEGCSSIVDLACGSDDFTTLCSLLSIYSGLVSELSDNDSEWTVFAPTDEAFAALTGDATDPVATLAESLSSSQLKKILMFHLVEDRKIYSTDFSCQSGAPLNLIEMYNGRNARIKCSRTDGTTTPFGIKGGENDSPSEFLEVDIDDAVCNGVIHVIDQVLLN